MNEMDIFYKILEQTNEIALATAINNIPNVRIVNFCTDPNRKGILYFASDRTNQKVMEFAVNNRISFTTIPMKGQSVPHIRSLNAVVQKSSSTIYDLKELFTNKIPGYDETIEFIGSDLDVFELQIQEAIIIKDYENSIRITF